ncbi:hypothetical protein ABVK25_004226 [Lepraria finkii]|uniref:Uncharacterized protein n=1 Tax=Lepraria finkii TaxID=1340010 RepID=A0ABR4BHJ3_9LECA
MGTETRESLQDFTSLPSFDISRFLTSTSSNNATTLTSTAASTSNLASNSAATSNFNSPLSIQPAGGAPTAPTTTSPPNSSGTPSGNVPPSNSPGTSFSTGLTAGGKAGIGIGSAVMLALFLWWLGPRRWTAKAKLKTNASTHTLPDAQQSAVTEVKETAGKHLFNNRVKTI